MNNWGINDTCNYRPCYIFEGSLGGSTGGTSDSKGVGARVFSGFCGVSLWFCGEGVRDICRWPRLSKTPTITKSDT